MDFFSIRWIIWNWCNIRRVTLLSCLIHFHLVFLLRFTYSIRCSILYLSIIILICPGFQFPILLRVHLHKLNESWYWLISFWVVLSQTLLYPFKNQQSYTRVIVEFKSTAFLRKITKIRSSIRQQLKCNNQRC